MGNLKPNATYVYERADGVVYAREIGSKDRIEIGRDYSPDPEVTVFGMPLKEISELVLIMKAAETNLSLQKALSRVKMLYYLSKDHGG